MSVPPVDDAWSEDLVSYAEVTMPAEPESATEPAGFARERREAVRAVEDRARAVEDAEGAVRLAEVVVNSADHNLDAVEHQRAQEELAGARRRLAAAMDRLDDAREDLAAVEARAREAQTQNMAPGTPQLFFRSLPDFVEYLCDTYRRQLSGKSSGLRWSARWFESREAVLRLDATWRAFEHLRLDGATGASTWLRDHLDYHMAILMSDTGPFSASRDAAEVTDRLPYEAPPEGQFPRW